MKKCPKCNSTLPDYVDTCSKCGVDLITCEKVLDIKKHENGKVIKILRMRIDSFLDLKILMRALLISTLVLPIITGLIAVLFKMPDPWTGFIKDPVDTFMNYSIPIPVAAGCLQLVFYPIIYLPLFVLVKMNVKSWVLFLYLIILIGFASKFVISAISPSDGYEMYPLVNVSVVSICILISKIVKNHKSKKIMR